VWYTYHGRLERVNAREQIRRQKLVPNGIVSRIDPCRTPDRLINDFPKIIYFDAHLPGRLVGIGESHFPAGSLHAQAAGTDRSLYQLPRALEGQSGEIVGGVHAGHVESQFDHVRRGNVSERHQFVLVDRAEAVLGNSRYVGPRNLEYTHRRRRVPRAFQPVGVLAQPRPAVAILHRQLRYRYLDPFVFLRLEAVHATANIRRSGSG
jgi:hypothetical protein